MGKKSVVWLLAGLLCISLASAATLSGNIYDLELKLVKNVFIEVNSVPRQQVVAVNGTYSLILPKGEYVLKARQADRNLLIEFPVNVEKEGDFVLDIVMMPSFEDIELLEGFEDNVDLAVDEPVVVWPWVIAGFIVGMVVFVLFRRKRPVEEKGELAEVLGIIRKEKRITQKELRNKLPMMSEAKVSLIITELVHNGRIKKIKKGRGNVLIAK